MAEYIPTSAAQDLKAWREGTSDNEYDAREFAVEGNDTSGYVGVSPEYQNYADDTQKPLTSKEVEEIVDEIEPAVDGELFGSSVIRKDGSAEFSEVKPKETDTKTKAPAGPPAPPSAP